MGLREDAYLKFLRGDTSALTENSVDAKLYSAFQGLAEKAIGKGGQLLYDDYDPNNPGMGELKATIGRLGKGGITREGNYWRIRDTYDFNPVAGGVMGDLEMAGAAIMSGDPVTTLGRLTHASNVGKAYPVDIRVPMTVEQIQKYNKGATAADRAVFTDGMQFGGKRYDWRLQDVAAQDSYDSIAKRQFAGSAYKPEGSNLAKMTDMVMRRNRGYSNSGKMWVPIEAAPELRLMGMPGEAQKAKQLSQTHLANTQSPDWIANSKKAVENLGKHLGRLMPQF